MYETFPDPSFNDRLINPSELEWRYSFVIKTPPVASPISLEDTKRFGRLDSMDEDNLIELFILAATQAAEEYLGRALMQQTIVLKMDWFPGVVALLPRFLATSALPVPLVRPPLVEVTEVRTMAEDDTVLQVWPLDGFYWLKSEPAKLVIRRGSVPPINVERYREGFEIEYTAGYGEPAATIAQQRAAIPAPIRMGLMLWTSVMYSQRGRAAANEPPADVRPLLDPYKVVRI